MREPQVFTCDGPGCDKTGGAEDFGRFGHWLTLTVPHPLTPYHNTQYGLVQERWEHHFHHPRCLMRWVDAQEGLSWTGKPSATGRIDPEWLGEKPS